MHKFTGIEICTTSKPEPTVSFSIDHLVKVRGLLQYFTPSMVTYDLGKIQTIFGNLVWITKVYSMLKPFAAGSRRCLQGVNTAKEAPSFQVDARHGDESKPLAAHKMYRDAQMMIQFLSALIQRKETLGENHHTCTVPVSAMTDPTVCYQQRFDIQFGSFGGDASGTAWSVLCHRLRQAMVIAMPAAFQHAIQHAGTLAQDNPLRRFLISIAEHMVYVMAMLQWGDVRQTMGYTRAFYDTDNQNSASWVAKGFANCS